ncbi:hypothetical protein SeLEV6574_g05688 [Synchytrium endobioticum]|uniref:Uncharacterized protein n=1 Tax=Synchytrium endobioticum TaxID=286115 RepID=A0A507CSY4_9FUNG|nr:hypothetical protein SeLEV6574_g05688 [Synchytrium endobioticum]
MEQLNSSRSKLVTADAAGVDLGTADTPSEDALRCAFNGRAIRPGPLLDLMRRRGTQRIVIDKVAHNAVSGALSLLLREQQTGLSSCE